MKKLHLIILLLTVTLSGIAQNVGDAFYIYRNDGGFNAFFRDEVQSIEYSYEDADGNTYDEIVTQIVTTADSIYKIPLAAIDSVGFIQPETIYAENVKMIDNLMPYIKGVDGMVLTLSSEIPKGITPNINDVLLYEKFDNSLFPFGFAGRVTAINNNAITCEAVTIDDIYQKLIGIGSIETLDDDQSAALRIHSRRISGGTTGSVKLLLPYGSEEEGFYGKLEGLLSFGIHVIYQHERGKSDYFNVNLSPHIGVALEAGIKGKLIDWKWVSKEIDLFYVPIPSTPFLLMITGVPVVSASLEASITARRELSWGCDLGVSYENGKWKKFFKNKIGDPRDLELQGDVKGRFFIGPKIGFGVYSVGKVLATSIKNEMGAEFVADMGTDFLNTDSYEELIKKQVDCNLTGKFSLEAELKFAKVLKLEKEWEIASFTKNLNSWKLFPTFSTPALEGSNSSNITLSIVPSEKLLYPVSIGMGLWKDNSLQDFNYCTENYRTIESWPLQKYQTSFYNIKPNTEYVVSPLVKIKGIEFRATPDATVYIKKDIPISITSFNINEATYSLNGFEHEGNHYTFRYIAETTVRLKNAESVEDWGYVYEDPNHQIKHISLKGHESPYTDTNYAFYRNEPRSTACLYGYVKYQGDENYYYGEKTDYPLVYDKQPEAITKEVSEVSATNAKVKCEYKEAAPWGGVCGVEYWKDSDHQELFFETANEEIEITLNNLSPNTTYYYRAFIKVGDKYYRAEETKSFTTQSPVTNLCPDENHPHLIDLGLPSGTKWACCNVGASSPGQHGGYYGWGDTNVKSYYWWDTLPYFVAWNGDNCIFNDIGSNIAGSSYDVAHVCWGGKWSMPTLDMIKELVENCDYQGGSSGLYFTGPNGNSIFIPFGGIITGDAYFFEDEAWLWSSTNAQHSNMDDAYILRCAQDNLSAYYSQTSYYAGCNVRPVQPGITVKTSEATDVKVVSATLNGKVDNYEALEGTVTYAFCYSTDEDVMNSFNVRTITATDDGNGNFSATIDDLEIETQYYYYAYIQKGEDKFFGDVMSFITNSLCPDENHPHMIDLGLPSGIKWACCNVGASNPRERGGYYAWGETFEKSSYSWESYTLYDINRTENAGYFDIAVDISGTDYDVAHVKWGSKWKMPSKTDFEELIANCGTKTITYYNDIFGYSNDYSILLIGSNGKAIILPQTGLRQDERPITDFGGLYYWSSTRDTRTKTGSMTASSGYRDAFYLGGWSSLSMGDCNRTQGFPIRPMWKE